MPDKARSLAVIVDDPDAPKGTFNHWLLYNLDPRIRDIKENSVPVIATQGQTWWILGMVLLITSSLLGSVNFLVTIIQLRAKGMTFMRLPFFVWAQFVTGFLLLLAFPPLEAAAVLQLMDRVAGTSFFLPSGLVVSGQVLHNAGGGNPLLWQHLFWFLAHPEVYVLILPAMGIVAEVIANNTRKPLWGYRSLVGAVVFSNRVSGAAPWHQWIAARGIVPRANRCGRLCAADLGPMVARTRAV